MVRGRALLKGASVTGERPLLRRLRQAGVAPEDGLDIAQQFRNLPFIGYVQGS